MFRATTPAHIFRFNLISAENIDKIKITYSQEGNVILEKNKDDIVLDGNDARVNLTQEETKLFDYEIPADVQTRVRTVDGRVFASDIFKVKVKEVLNDEVM